MDVCVVAVFSVKRVWFATRLCLHVWCGKSCVEFIQFMSAFVDSSRSWDQSYNVYPIVFKFTISTLWIACSWTWSANDNSDGGNVKVGYWMTWVMSALVIGQCSHLFVGSNAFWKGSVFSCFGNFHFAVCTVERWNLGFYVHAEELRYFVGVGKSCERFKATIRLCLL